MHEPPTPSEYLRLLQPMLGVVWSDLEHFDFVSETLDMSLSNPDNVSPKNEAYRKWFDDWIAMSNAVHELVIKARELHDSMEGVIKDLENRSAKWVVIEPTATKAES